MQAQYGYPVVESLPFVMGHEQEKPCCSSKVCPESKKPLKQEDGSIPLSVTTMVQATMLMMAGTIAYNGYVACTAGTFECTPQKFPDISHLMGGPPQNKLYAIMLTTYSCVKQAEARAYYHRLSGFVSPLVNNILLLAALVSFIFGPLIGFFDCYYDMDHHMLATGLFTGGEVVYVYLIMYVISTNREQFPSSAGNGIFLSQIALVVVLVTGTIMHYKHEFPQYAVDQIGEWIAFFLDFFVRFQIASFIRYTGKVVPQA